MQKIIVFCLAFWIVMTSMPLICRAEEYTSYQEIVFDDDDAILLKSLTEEDYATYYALLDEPRMWGWQIGVVMKNETLEFISETKLRIVNDGYSTIRHDITLTTKEETKFQLSASGGVSVEVKGDIKKFKGTIDANIKAEIAYTKTTTSSETYTFEIDVDPETYVRIVTRGKGELSNGVAKHYFLWIETKRGGWETFVVTTEYYEIIKEKIA
ncbi:MAG: CIA30 family protein [Candidatus Izemoplasmatales bacterium]|nr:CIA30 family protein [Candidatus Izemoplasmatales bacterium]